MGGRMYTSQTPRRPETDSAGADSLERLLSLVVEQDGVTITTPQGSHKKRKQVQTFTYPTAQDVSSPAEISVADEIQAFDEAVVRHSITPLVQIRSHAVNVRRGEHQQSAYVVSLQSVSFHQEVEDSERTETADALFSPALAEAAHGVPFETYATVSTDLMSGLDLWSFSEQFTPDSFEKCYAQSYGNVHRVRSALYGSASFFKSLFQRVEHAEQQVVQDVEATLHIVEVPRFSFARAVVGFAALALVVTLPANAVALYRSASAQKTAATDASQAAISSVMAAAKSGSVPQSADALKQASSRFRQADALLSDVSALALGIASVVPTKYRSARALLEVGDKSSEAGRLLALGLDKVFADPDRRLDERLDSMGAYARTSLTLLSDASKAAASVDVNAVPAEQRGQVTSLLTNLHDSTQAVQEFSALAESLSMMVGRDHLRKYLVVFQNQTELRPTGGFMGSFAEITFDRGAIKSIRVPPGGTYDLKGQLTERIAPPQPLQLVSPLWQFQDANWSPDFPTSAEKIRWFWSKSGQSTVDGVIAVNASVMEKMLALTGPIEMPEYGKTIDKDSFLLETQKAVELEYDKVNNTPKKFVGDLGMKLLEKIKTMDRSGWLGMMRVLSDSLETKDIQVAFSNADEEALAERYGWSGRIKPTFGDALALIETNVAGQKTDGVVTESVAHKVDIQEDGSIEDTVTLNRAHQGTKGELFSGVRNVVYLRAYVPKGSTLIEATGFETPDKKLFKTLEDDVLPDAKTSAIESTQKVWSPDVTTSEEGDRSVIAGWLQLDPGDSQVVTLRYKLPMTVSDMMSHVDSAPENGSADAVRTAYLLLSTSQSGKSQRAYTTSIHYPPSWNISWSRPEVPPSASGDVEQSSVWDRDLVSVLLFAPHDKTSALQTTSN